MSDIQNFVKSREYLVMVDSDGCAMDTMDIKHSRCFGPCMVEEWGLEEWRDEILNQWNDINLYTLTRGINRFRGLATVLGWVSEKYREIEDLFALIKWVESSSELSNAALEREIKIRPSVSLKKAMCWSESVNLAIRELPRDDIMPFRFVDEALRSAHKVADVVVVSSANLGAVLDEWGRHGLLNYTNSVMAQNSGSKSLCIKSLLDMGYDPKKAIMCGDAFGDLVAAEENGVYFYPILARHESDSWREFIDIALPRLIDGSYGDGYAEKKKNDFVENLKKRSN